ncbi:Biotin carboxyl carrier protein of acetyl-CoA carboxylase 1, chloroplastic [Sarracenia purpurea var. burkii]
MSSMSLHQSVSGEKQIMGLQSSRNLSNGVKAQLNEVAVGGSSNDAASPNKSDVPALEAKGVEPSSKLSPQALASEESISEFITQVTSLVKFVDSRDIVELQLKQLDCELLIRKKEALPHPTSSAPFVMMHSPPSPAAVPPAFQALPPATAQAPSASAPSTSSSLSTPAAKSAKSSLPPLKCPMSGTFYRSPAPGEPPFVKVILL